MRILFLARSLRMGGAERQMAALALGLARAGHQASVAVFYPGGAFEEPLRAGGVPVFDLAKRGRWDTLPFLLRALRLVRREKPEVLHSYMDSPNIVGAALKRLSPRVTLVWGLRTSKQDLTAYDWMQTAGARLERLAAPAADGIIANSEAARAQALRAGFPSQRLFVVPNGIDCQAFRLDPAGRAELRALWGVPEGAPLVGLVARLDPVKNHANFLRAAALVAAEVPEARFVCVGGAGREAYRKELLALAEELGLAPRLTWAGERPVTRAEYSAFDLAVLASDGGEGFPNVVAEAMACERPVATTRSGDVERIVGDAGVVVPPRDHQQLGAAMVELLRRAREPGATLGARARARIEAEFSVDALVRRSLEVLREIHEKRKLGA